MNKKVNRIITMLLALAMCLSIMAPVSVQAADKPMSTVDMKPILNGAALYPQRTGYSEIDDTIANLLRPYENADTYTKVKVMYDWVVKYVKYSWEGYSKTTAPAYDCFEWKYDLTYQEGLQESLPKDMVYRTHHSLSAKKGVCYDYAILFAVMARYIGLEAYVHTGYYDFEDWSGIAGSGHHGWAEIVIDGQTYIFDPQRDNRYTTYCGVQTTDFFGIPWSGAWRYQVALDVAENAARDAQMLPVDEHRHHNYEISVICSASGSGVTGTGIHLDCEEITLTSSSSVPVKAWYTLDGTLLASGASYTPAQGEDISMAAIFEGDYFMDVPRSAWYTDHVNRAAENGIIKGITPIIFDAKGALNRAMVVQLLARIEGADTASAAVSPFTDVDQDAWYAGAVNWAYENKVITGISETEFAPAAQVTREEFITMVIRYLSNEGYVIEGGELRFSDAANISSYALEPMRQAKTINLVQGYPDNTVLPQAGINRGEGAVLIMRMLDYMADAS